MKHITMLVVVVLASTFSVSLAHAQTAPSDEQARALAIEAVTKATGTAKAELNTRRLENLEDDFFSFQRLIKGQIKKAAYFYHVQDGGWHIISPDEVTYSTHSSRVWYVAISTTDGEAFGLFGFKNATEDFTRLVTKLPVEVLNTSKAQSFARFYLDMIYQQQFIIYDELSLKHHAEDHFVGYANSQEPIAKKEQRFHHWWNEFKATKMTGPLAPTAKAEGNNRYRVEMKILQMTVGLPPELWQWSLEIHSDGASRLVEKRPLFPTKVGTTATTR
ncbi:MAG: hypothetical protein WBN92_04215 [Terriglobia bacterium]